MVFNQRFKFPFLSRCHRLLRALTDLTRALILKVKSSPSTTECSFYYSVAGKLGNHVTVTQMSLNFTFKETRDQGWRDGPTVHSTRGSCEDEGSVPSIHTGQFANAWELGVQGIRRPPLAIIGTRHARGICRHSCLHIKYK